MEIIQMHFGAQTGFCFDNTWRYILESGGGVLLMTKIFKCRMCRMGLWMGRKDSCEGGKNFFSSFYREKRTDHNNNLIMFFVFFQNRIP